VQHDIGRQGCGREGDRELTGRDAVRFEEPSVFGERRDGPVEGDFLVDAQVPLRVMAGRGTCPPTGNV
jgi:hypothetical protein